MAGGKGRVQKKRTSRQGGRGPSWGQYSEKRMRLKAIRGMRRSKIGAFDVKAYDAGKKVLRGVQPSDPRKAKYLVTEWQGRKYFEKNFLSARGVATESIDGLQQLRAMADMKRELAKARLSKVTIPRVFYCDRGRMVMEHFDLPTFEEFRNGVGPDYEDFISRNLEAAILSECGFRGSDILVDYDFERGELRKLVVLDVYPERVSRLPHIL